MTDIVEPTDGALSSLRAELAALAQRTTTIENQYAAIIALLTEIKSGRTAGPPRSEFVGKRG